ncbi:MAG: hypothetical protein Q7W16_03790 [Coriobacteriia bacterium]|nr:hypothetical protein [Coriobacteriia bacterium]
MVATVGSIAGGSDLVRAMRALPAAAMGTLFAAALLIGACTTTPRVAFTADAGVMSATEIDALASSADLGPVEGVDIEQAPDVRTDALVWLREQGAAGDRAATLLTIGFPARTAAVPLIVSVARVEGVQSLIVVEAFGGKSGPLSSRRLWVFDYKTGDLLRSASFR